MPITHNPDELLDPKTIIVDRDNRQRKKIDIAGLKPSIQKYGVLNPIIIKNQSFEDGSQGLVLVAGERRLQSCIELNIQVPVRYWENLDTAEKLEETKVQVIELEENLKRSDLDWKDQVRAISQIHKLYSSSDPTWTVTKTAEALSYNVQYIYSILNIAKHLDTDRLKDANGISHAEGILARFAERRTAGIVEELKSIGSKIFGEELPILPTPDNSTQHVQTSVFDTNNHANCPDLPQPQSADTGNVPGLDLYTTAHTLRPSTQDVIIQADFTHWVKTYTGPKFNLIHCDFPYGVNTADAQLEGYENTPELYFYLLDFMLNNQDKFISQSAHLICWLSMKFFIETKRKVQNFSWKVIDRPLIWHKSDMRGSTSTDMKQPRHTYEAAILAYRGERPLVKQIGDSYACPSPDRPIHPTQKPEPLLRYFLSGLVDETTLVFDPTAGSGSALRVADELGARTVLGLELNSEFQQAANIACLRARSMRGVKI